ncbi:MAG: hypothetical protein WCO60_09970 [Verrucomicrobiota bacterium]
MKSISLLTLVAVAFGLGACQSKSCNHDSKPMASKSTKGFKK